MTDAQFGTLIAAILSGLAGIGTVFKWGIGRIVKAIDSNSDSMIANTASNAILATKIDGIASWVLRADRDNDRDSKRADRDSARADRDSERADGDHDEASRRR